MTLHVDATESLKGLDASCRAHPQGSFTPIGHKPRSLSGEAQAEIDVLNRGTDSDGESTGVIFNSVEISPAANGQEPRIRRVDHTSASQPVPHRSSQEESSHSRTADKCDGNAAAEPRPDAKTQDEAVNANCRRRGRPSRLRNDIDPKLENRPRNPSQKKSDKAGPGAAQSKVTHASSIPVTTRHVVQQGEFLSLIGEQYGLAWQDIWNDASNALLREQRETPNVLFPGDVLYIPRRMYKYDGGETENRHRYHLKGSPNRLRLIMKDMHDAPLADVPYRLAVPHSAEVSGITDQGGLIDEMIPLKAERVTLFFLDEEYVLKIGALDPVARITGVQQRLENLGFSPGPIDGIVGPLTNASLRRFQESAGIEETSVADIQSRRAIEKAHDGETRDAPMEDDPGIYVEPPPRYED